MLFFVDMGVSIIVASGYILLTAPVLRLKEQGIRSRAIKSFSG